MKRDKLDKKSELVIFLGYGSNSKGYRMYNLETKKILINRDVKFDEFSKWNWEKCQAEGSSKGLLEDHNLQDQSDEGDEENYDSDDDFPTRGTRTLEDIYARCNVATLEPTRYDEVAESESWKAAMEEKMNMTKKNKTWLLVDRPSDKKVIGVK